MADKDLRRLGRPELLEVIKMLQDENSALEKKIEELEKKLEDKRIIMQNAGSIAEASLQLNKIFEVAQATADQYINSVKVMYGAENSATSHNTTQQYSGYQANSTRNNTDKQDTSYGTDSGSNNIGIEFIDN